MNEQSGILAGGGMALCGWCGVPLGSANTFKKKVCVRCVNLLKNAGIADEEIFFEETAGRNKSLSPDRTETDANPTKKPQHL